MPITDGDLVALAALSEWEPRRLRDMPDGVGRAALTRLERFKLAKVADRHGADGYLRTPNGTGVLRNHAGRLDILRRLGKLTDAQAAEVAAVTAPRTGEPR